jgi:hypothetical protein
VPNLKVVEYSSASTNQYDQLSRVFEYNGYMIYLNGSPRDSDESLSASPDVVRLIPSLIDEKGILMSVQANLSKYENTYVSPRFAKPIFLENMRRYVRDEIKNTGRPRIYIQNTIYIGSHGIREIAWDYLDETRPYVIKPSHGARGIGQFLVPAEKLYLLPDIMHLMKAPDTDEENWSMVICDFVRDKGIPHASWMDDEKYVIESKGLWRGEIYAEEWLDIRQEWRVILHKGGIVIVPRVQGDHVGYRQAYEYDLDGTFSYLGEVKDADFSQRYGDTVAKVAGFVLQFCELFFEWEGMQSLDVYELANGEMGFLEQSNQFAIERLVCKPSIKTHMMDMFKELVSRRK